MRVGILQESHSFLPITICSNVTNSELKTKIEALTKLPFSTSHLVLGKRVPSSCMFITLSYKQMKVERAENLIYQATSNGLESNKCKDYFMITF